MIVIITGKAGSGKSTLRKKLLESLPSFTKTTSYTTREPRIDEVQNVDYIFVSHSEFANNKNIILKREESGNMYGVDKCSLQLTILDTNGINEINKLLPNEQSVIICLEAPNRVLIQRMQERGTNLRKIYERLSTDKGLVFDNLREQFKNIPILSLNSTQPIEATVQQSIDFIKNICISNLVATLKQSKSNRSL